ncbi:MAG: hypothetical protein MUE41_13615, partial [Gemmatimonadaceae bacterium]|nr:hypothetical protein [Gemmatimonadaceae bacterium]
MTTTATTHSRLSLPDFPRLDRVRPTAAELAHARAYNAEMLARLTALLKDPAARARLTQGLVRQCRLALKAADGDPRLPVTPRRLLVHAGRLRRLVAAALGDPTLAEHRQRDVGRPPREPVARAPRFTVPRALTLDEVATLVVLGERLLHGQWSLDELRAHCTPQPIRQPVTVPLAALVHLDQSLPPIVRLQVEWLRHRLIHAADGRTALRALTGRTRLTSTDRKRLARWEAACSDGATITIQMVGQRTPYRLLPILQALILVTYFARRGAVKTRIADEAWRALERAVALAAERGLQVPLDDRSAAARARASAALQLELAADGGRTAPTVRRIVRPDRSTITRFLATLPQAAHAMRATGLDHVLRNRAPRDAFWAAAYPNEYWEVDSTQLDLLVAAPRADEAGSDHEAAVPLYFTVVQDVYSRLIVGYYAWVEPPTAASVCFALFNALQPAPQLG